MHQKIIWFFAVIPAEAGIQMYLNFLDSGSRYPGLHPGLPGMTFHFCCVLCLQNPRAFSPIALLAPL
jgi:hypothetical protein